MLVQKLSTISNESDAANGMSELAKSEEESAELLERKLLKANMSHQIENEVLLLLHETSLITRSDRVN
jgi:hypothetical protein